MSQVLGIPRFPTVYNPKDKVLYVDHLEEKEPSMDIPLIDTEEMFQSLTAEGGLAAAAAQRVYFENDEEDYNFENRSNQFQDDLLKARAISSRHDRDIAIRKLQTGKHRDFYDSNVIAQACNPTIRNHAIEVERSRAAAVITSQNYANFQSNAAITGILADPRIRTGILVGLFETVNLPTLSGKYAAFTDDLKYFRNLAETKSPEPSGGTGTIQTVTVQKHGGAVAITDRATMVINQDNPFQRLVTRMGLTAQKDENAMMAAEIQSNTGNTISGVDFGIRTGTPPSSTQNPIDLITSMLTTSESSNVNFDLFISKGFMWAEYSTNDIVRGGVNTVPITQTNLNEQISPFPLFGGVTWARDNAITSSTAGWLLTSQAIKAFRSISRNYTIANQDTETTKYVTKNYFLPKTIDTSLVYNVTGIAA